MKKIIQIVVAVVVIASMTGCASTNAYLADRGRDAADVLTCTIGLGIGAKVRVGPIQTGWLKNADLVGVRGGQAFAGHLLNDTTEYEVGPVAMLSLPVELVIYTFFPDYWAFLTGNWGDGAKIYRDWSTGHDLFRLTLTPKPSETLKLRGKEIDSRNTFLVITDDSIQHLSQVEVVAGLGPSVRLGFNPGELLDFMLGWTTIDIFNDDLETKKYKEKSNHTLRYSSTRGRFAETVKVTVRVTR